MLELSEMQRKVFEDRYAMRDKDGELIETSVEQMWRRVANAIAVDGKQANRFYDVLDGFRFVPGGRILSGAGTGADVTFYNCFVIPSPEDSRDGIMDNIKLMVNIMARGGGVGVNLSTLRPRGSHIKTVNGTSSGPVSWAELYSVATHDVIQQGGTRRGALMIMLDDDHPDIEEFVKAKRDLKKLNGANISVAVSDRFMEKVKNNEDWELIWNDKVYKVIKAKYLWDLICESAWMCAEPGVVFMERYQNESNTKFIEDIRCVNPCGEQGLPPWGVCNLGAVNLNAHVFKNTNTGEYYIHQELLEDTVKTAVEFLDRVIDVTPYFNAENEKAQKSVRRIGLGTMGLADMLLKLKVRYGSTESLSLIAAVYARIEEWAYEQSIELARTLGVFPALDDDTQAKIAQRLERWTSYEELAECGIRNAVLLTQAPTGSTSLLAGTSSGIEPIFSFATMRQDRIGTHYIYHPLAEQWQKKYPNAELPDYFVTASQLTPDEHVQVQAVIQKYTDSSISKTVNAPNNYTIEDVKKLYSEAYRLGCKGITVYREGSRDAVLVDISKPTTVEKDKVVEDKGVRDRATTLSGYTRQIKAPEGKVHVTINSDSAGPYEVFINIGRAGSDISALAEALGRTISYVLQMPNDTEYQERLKAVAEDLSGIGGSRSEGFGLGRVRSLPDAVAKVLQDYPEDTVYVPVEAGVKEVKVSMPTMLGDLCPECGTYSLARQEGCKKCHNCGYAEC